ncbi:MAG: alcohol dehydrogenase catalytic domain-containing protein [Negativicutes bacterium]|nr:alcohol dehydrogenase catalytic domain-containing protein [Negativicutes bacterium]
MMMRAGYLAETKKLEVREVEVPACGDKDVLISVKAAGLCGSDFHTFHGSHPFRKAPMILGHEAAGEVVKVGAKVSRIKVGDRVTVEPIMTCGTCIYCRNGQYNLCPNRIPAGLGGWIGSFAEYFVAEEKRVHLLPPELDYDLGVLVEPLAVGVHAVRMGNVTPGSSCAILGAGTIGLLAGVAAQEAGASRVFCTDINTFRLEKAREMGMFSIKADTEPVEDIIRAAEPDGPEVILLAVTSPAVLDQAIKLVRRGGKVVVIALFSKPITFDINTLQGCEIDLKGSHIYTKEDFDTAMKILVDRKADLQKAITHHVNFNGMVEAFEMLADPQNTAIKVIVKPE